MYSPCTRWVNRGLPPVYGNPGEAIHQESMVPERLEGFVGEGSEERPYTHVIVDRIEDLDNLNL